MSPRDLLMCCLFAVIMPTGQVMFKWAALTHARLDGALPLRLLKNLPLLGAFAWYGLTALFWFYILTRVPLSRAYAFAVVGSSLVPVFAFFIFKEPMSWRYAAGYALMILGLMVIMRAQGRA